MNIPTVIIELRNGKIDGIVSDRALKAVVIDHSLYHYSDDPLRNFPIADGETKKVFAKNWGRVDRSPGFIRAALKTLGFKR